MSTEEQLRADLARVTAERNVNAMQRDQYAHAESENADLRARVAELVAALRDVIGWAKPSCAHEVRDYDNARCILARAESATPAKHPDTEDSR